jgi:hypothetical protein
MIARTVMGATMNLTTTPQLMTGALTNIPHLGAGIKSMNLRMRPLSPTLVLVLGLMGLSISVT